MGERTIVGTVIHSHEKITELLRLDEQLIHALFEPAVSSGCLSSSTLDWMAPLCPDKAGSFVTSLLPLSNFYRGRNPVLAAALWGVWNTLSYLRRQRSLLTRLLQGQKTKSALFIHYRALVSAAAVQFHDGEARTEEQFNAFNDLDAHRHRVAAAISSLKV